ncbi:hypothetical protein DM02DRAFT_732772 [Periconia macrospinosa]|uniref:Trichothecene 3-O-acetyltransferase-like N-terminal domain-containing protein n=1 Tax=Periconia macrospinosa TaxID=97972 RepID=A0A2V1D7J0_9PLEO|nr:hypothetical protein DM02DRAFT_732772 [Periconia macrospinosa]
MGNADVAVNLAKVHDLGEKGANLDDASQSLDSELYQDVVSQFPFLNGYSHIVFLFEPAPDVSKDTILSTLANGLEKLTTQIPWLAGQVLHTPGPPGTSGHYALAPWPTDAKKNDMLRSNDCESLMPPLSRILRAGAPMSMLDAKVLTPFPSLPVPHGLEPPLPVLQLQVNFLSGGIILNMSTHHMVIDGTGIVQIMRHLSTTLQGGTISPSDVVEANRDRRRVVPLIPSGEPVKDHSFLRAPPGHITKPPSSPPKWCCFKLPVTAIPALEKLAAPAQQPAVQQSLSDNDILSAFCWQRITAVRLARGGGFAPSTPTKMTRAIDARAAMGVPLSYMGHLTYFSSSQLPMEAVASQPLWTIAQTLRRDLTAANTPWAIRSYATFLSREPDRSRLVYAGVRNLDTDLGTTAFTASQEMRREDESSAIPRHFGPVLGLLRYTRRPDTSPMPGGITVCPVEGGAVPLLLCMPEVDLEGLQKDALWRRFMSSRLRYPYVRAQTFVIH